MIKTMARGSVLQDYLLKHTLNLLGLYAKMIAVTEGIRRAIQQSDQLTLLELI